jgi:hypothetical protein
VPGMDCEDAVHIAFMHYRVQHVIAHMQYLSGAEPATGPVPVPGMELANNKGNDTTIQPMKRIHCHEP